MKIRFLVPLLLFFLIAAILWRGLRLHPNQIPSPFINKPAPAFVLPNLLHATKTVSNKEFYGHVSLFNVWASWCSACTMEHAYLVELAATNEITLYGLNYKDDTNTAKKWLSEHGNPYRSIAVDKTGDTAINWGVYGAPETFVIDKKGIVRYKQIGPITSSVWEQDLKPLITRLQAEA